MDCIFCQIVSRKAPANIRYEDDEVAVIENVLRWLPVMLLVIPKKHMTQQEMWASEVLSVVGKVALEMGKRYCPGGFRLLSNLGADALQTQEHGHLHVLGGTTLGFYA